MDVNLVLFKKNGSQKSFSLPSNITVIGRRHDCDLCIPLDDVSRRHCQIDLNNETLEVRDLGSRNGTYLNDQQVNGETPVTAGDYLRIGSLTFQLQIDGEPEKTTPPKDNGSQAVPGEPVLTSAEDDEDDFLDLDLEMDVDPDDSGAFLDELEEL